MSSDDGTEGVRPNGAATVVEADLADLLTALRAARDGDFSQRLTPRGNGAMGQVADALNALLQRNDPYAYTTAFTVVAACTLGLAALAFALLSRSEA